ncbi:MAG: GNAT family N-acetyltransferase [Candidatus Acidiferrum sp.]
MIRQCRDAEFDVIHAIINDAAMAYEGVIPPDCWKESYMSKDELRHEIGQGIVFWGFEQLGELAGVMGIQDVQDVTLIRHAYVRTAKRNQGIGGELLTFLRSHTGRPILIGTWADAVWAVRFYEERGFRLVSTTEKDRLLKKYWSVPQRQIETSVVLADRRWFERPDNREPEILF